MRKDPDWSLSNCEPRRDPATHDVTSWEAVFAVLASLGLIAYLAGMVWVVWFNGDSP
jgi:hypothetical protein